MWHREVRVTVDGAGNRTETVERDWFQEQGEPSTVQVRGARSELVAP